MLVLTLNHSLILTIDNLQAEVITCEICGGLIQGVQALRVHMQWCHNMNITHLKKPEFQCFNSNCGKLFWTVQGMAKHSTVSNILPFTSTRCAMYMYIFYRLIS